MPALLPEERAAIVEAAMKRKFGDLLAWTRPTLVHTFGPNDLDVVDIFEAKLFDAKKVVLDALANWSDETMQEMGALLKNGSRIEESNWAALARPDIEDLSRHPPKPIAFGFGHPSFQADFGYWGKMPELTIFEALALSVGADPKAFPEDRVLTLVKTQSKGETLWSAFDFLAKRYEQFRRHFSHNGWAFISETPSELKSWIDKIELPVHPEFYAELSKRSAAEKLVAAPPIPVGLSRQERETLLKLVAAMACEQYQYDPKQERSEATSRIMEDIELVGLSMDAKTIRKWLKEAAELVDPAYWSSSA